MIRPPCRPPPSLIGCAETACCWGAYRYGCLGDQRQAGGNGRNNVGSAIRRLRAYLRTGNTEHLVDAANLCRVEFVAGSHPRKHWAAADDDGEHAEERAKP